MNTTEELASKEVAAGVAWLDEHQPGWADRINLRSFYLPSTATCVICQVTGEYYSSGLEKLGLYDPEKPETFYLDGSLGFDAPLNIRKLNEQDQWYVNAERLWRQAIAERTQAKTDATVG